MQACLSSRYQPDQHLSQNEKTEVEITEIKPGLDAGSQEPVPEAGMGGALSSLWSPESAIPTPRSGHIVYECALLLGEQWPGSWVVTG